MGSERIVVVTGGAGYLGQCAAEGLRKSGYEPVLLDNFLTSRRPSFLPSNLFDVDLSDLETTRAVFGRLPRVHAVMHFAAKALVPESCHQPEEYFRNNFLATLNTAQCCIEKEVPFLVNSSSCAVYGKPEEDPITENAALAPLSPYGETKVLCERLLQQLAKFRSLRILNLRYFNPAGAFGGTIGEQHEPETHLIPLLVRAAISRVPLSLYGNDYPTPDGTCVRDFIHVEDLIEAHVAALHLLESGKAIEAETLNVGSGRGVSIREAIQTAEKVMGRSIEVNLQARRPGDPPKLVADISLATRVLKWSPSREFEQIISDHYLWEKLRVK